MIKDVLNDTRARMKGAITALEDDLAAVRTGRASPALVDKLLVDYYDTPTPLYQLANISVPEAQLIVIRPFDPSTIKIIERSILASDLGLTPSNDGVVVRLVLPPLNEERRRELSRMVGKRVEEARIAIRNVRRDALEDLRELEKEKMVTEDDFHRGKDSLQDVTNDFVKQVDAIGERKEQEIMEV